MKKILSLSFAVLMASTLTTLAGGAGWMTDLDKAFAKARAEDKPVLVEFTGSDWCPPCIMMRREVFTKKEFLETAAKKFILVEIDIPNGDPDLKKKNVPILEKHGVRGVPTVVLFGPDAKEFDRFVASAYPSVKEFLGHLDQALARRDFN